MTKQKTAEQTPEDYTPRFTDDDLLPPSAQTATAVAEPVAAVPAIPAGGVMMTAADIADIVRAATSAVAGANNSAIADAISQALTQHMGPRRMTVAEMGEPKTPFNPFGRKRELLSEFFQNGFPIQERSVSDEEIEMLHQLVPGSYGTPDFPIAVIEKKRLGGKNRVHVLYADGKDDRLKIKNYAPNFHGVLVKLVQEAKEQRAQRRAEARALLAEDNS